MPPEKTNCCNDSEEDAAVAVVVAARHPQHRYGYLYSMNRILHCLCKNYLLIGLTEDSFNKKGRPDFFD
jgi:hypothetical protein